MKQSKTTVTCPFRLVTHQCRLQAGVICLYHQWLNLYFCYKLKKNIGLRRLMAEVGRRPKLGAYTFTHSRLHTNTSACAPSPRLRFTHRPHVSCGTPPNARRDTCRRPDTVVGTLCRSRVHIDFSRRRTSPPL